MGEATTEPDALLTWFKRQRRDWWRANWWKWVLFVAGVIGLGFAIPLGITLFTSLRFGVPFPRIAAQVGVFNWALPPIGYLCLILLSNWQVADLGRSYRVPAELLIASRPVDCTRVFKRLFRQDVYVVYGLVVMLPVLILLVYSILDGVFLHSDTGIIVYMLALQVFINEVVVALHAARRHLAPFTYFITPVLLLFAGTLLPHALVNGLDLLAGYQHEALLGLVSILLGLGLVFVASRLDRLPWFTLAEDTAWVDE